MNSGKLKSDPVRLVSMVANIVLILALILFFIYDNPSGTNEQGVPKLSQELQNGSITKVVSSTSSEVEQIIDTIGTHMLLPQGTVTITTVVDAEKLKEQNPELFEYAQNGQKLIFYPNGLIIYDAGRDRIVDVIRLPRQVLDRLSKGQ